MGCGGTIARHAAAGDQVDLLFLSKGVGAREERREDAVVQRRLEAAREASALLGVRSPRMLGFPDNALDSVSLLEVVRAVEKMIIEIAPDVVYTHHGGDLNVDHQLAHQAVLTACRPQPGSPVRAIYAFEILSSTEWASSAAPVFRPSRFVDIGDFLDTKLRALTCYEEELRPFPHARSVKAVEALARIRGTSVGCDAAEAFIVVREIF